MAPDRQPIADPPRGLPTLFVFLSVFFFFFFFNVDHFKVFIELILPLLLFYVFWPPGMWNLSSPSRDRTCVP